MRDLEGLEEAKDRFLVLDEQRFDLRFDFFLCPSHGLIVPQKFDSEWNTDHGCPVPTYKEEPCDEALQAVFLDSTLSLIRKQAQEEERQRIREALLTALAPAQCTDSKVNLSAVTAALDSLAKETPDGE